MYHPIASTLKPGLGLIIKDLSVYKCAVKKKVVLDIFNRVLNLALALGIASPAKSNLKPPAGLIPMKNICHNIISAIFPVQKNSVLIIDYLHGYTSEELKCLLMGYDCIIRSKGPVKKQNKFLAAVTQKHHEKVHPDPFSGTSPKLLLSEVNLSQVPGREIRHC